MVGFSRRCRKLSVDCRGTVTFASRHTIAHLSLQIEAPVERTVLWPLVALAMVGLGLSACSGPTASTLGPTPTGAVQPAQTSQVEKPGLPSEILANGAELYIANCQACHGDQRGQGGAGAPPHNEDGHTWHHPDAKLKEWVTIGKLGFGGPAMPAFGDKLSEPEVDVVLAYIKAWWNGEQRESQADISRRYQEALDKQHEK